MPHPNARRLADLAAGPPRSLPPVRPSKLVTNAYVRSLQAIPARLARAIERLIQVLLEQDLVEQTAMDAAVRQDAPRVAKKRRRSTTIPPDVEQALAQLTIEVGRISRGLAVSKTVLRVVRDLDRLNKAQVNGVLRSIGLDPFAGDAPLTAARDAFVRENADLIRRIPTDMAERIGKRVTSGVADGKRWTTIAKEIQGEQGIGERRARLIARDQVSKFNGKLNEVRQVDAGVTHYRWQGAMDARERPTHVALQGRIFAWDKPGPEGHPGTAINCRCTAIPVVSEREIAKAEDISVEQLQREAKALGPKLGRGRGR